MSRKARAETWRAIAWRGEPEICEHSTFVVTLPRRFASRYGATGRLRWTSVDPPGVEIVSVLVVDRDGDGEVRLEVKGDRVTLSARRGATSGYVSKLWADASEIFTLTRRPGPAPGSGLTREQLLAKLVVWDGEWRPTAETVAGVLRVTPRWLSVVSEGWNRLLDEAEALRGQLDRN